WSSRPGGSGQRFVPDFRTSAASSHGLVINPVFRVEGPIIGGTIGGHPGPPEAVRVAPGWLIVAAVFSAIAVGGAICGVLKARVTAPS
ncbi:MAG: hypothetical protein WAR36_02980, partial [Candidatus Methanoculleus thermohydrogenotrophicum]